MVICSMLKFIFLFGFGADSSIAMDTLRSFFFYGIIASLMLIDRFRSWLRARLGLGFETIDKFSSSYSFGFFFVKLGRYYSSLKLRLLKLLTICLELELSSFKLKMKE